MKVYINFGSDSEKFYKSCFSRSNFNQLIDAVAKNVRYSQGIPLIKVENGQDIVCKGRTKKYIAQEACRFISKMNITPSSFNMAPYVSKRQINRLIRSIEKHGVKHFTCYAFVILHIIYMNIHESNFASSIILANEIHNLVIQYLENHPDMATKDPINYELLYFLNSCYTPVKDEITDKKITPSTLFPAIKKRIV